MIFHDGYRQVRANGGRILDKVHVPWWETILDQFWFSKSIVWREHTSGTSLALGTTSTPTASSPSQGGLPIGYTHTSQIK